MAEPATILAQALIVAIFVAVHLFAGRLRFLDGIPRSRWLSFAGGVSVAYVFLHILPELAEAGPSAHDVDHVVPLIWRDLYVVALGGLAVFYGLERALVRAQGQQAYGGDEGSTTVPTMFWLHVASFAAYNALIGYLLVHREEHDLRGLVLFGGAMALHFLVNDYGLRQDHKESYARHGRWVLAAAVVLGWSLGLTTQVSALAVDVAFAFLAGGIVLNVLKEELPEERESRFLPFAIGVGGYACILLFI